MVASPSTMEKTNNDYRAAPKFLSTNRTAHTHKRGPPAKKIPLAAAPGTNTHSSPYPNFFLIQPTPPTPNIASTIAPGAGITGAPPAPMMA